jgi:electron transfer flavoprotein beta subunit
MKTLNMIVCVKQVPDPEIPIAKFKIDSEAKRVVPPEGIPQVMSTFDEQAVEAALRIKEQSGGKITAISMGGSSTQDVIRHALAMGVDEGIVIGDETYAESNSFYTAYVLGKAIEKIGNYGLVLCGRQAADWDMGGVGSLIAEILNIPIISFVRKVEPIDDKLKIQKVIEEGYEVIEVFTPAVVTITTELGEPRIPSAWGAITAARKQIPLWQLKDLGIDLSKVGVANARSKLLRLFIPSHDRKCDIIGGESPAEAAMKLAVKLREKGLV